MRLAEQFQLRSLTELAEKTSRRLDELVEPSDGWEAAVPSWAGRGEARGLAEWGSRDFKKKRKSQRKWQSGGLCQMVIQHAITFYLRTIGLPPVVTGVRGKKKKKKNRRRQFGGSGHTRGQKVLVPEENPVDLCSLFMIVIHAYYCIHLDPPVDDGTDASDAVFFALCGDATRRRLMSSVRIILTHTPSHIPTQFRHVIL